jgi:hypothetical protein
MVESQVRHKCKFDIIKVLSLRCQKMFGFVPDDLTIDFKPLRILSAEQEENVKTQKFSRLQQAVQAGLITVKEYKDACNKENLFGIQVDTEVEQLTPMVGAEGATEAPKAPEGTHAAPTAKNSNDKMPGGKGDKLTEKDVDPEEFAMGLKVEMEHTTDKEIAREIALDHLAEDPKYYTKLKKVEG